MNIEHVEALISLCQKHGIRRVKVDEVEIEFAEVRPQGPDESVMRELSKALSDGTMTNEEALFASAPQLVSKEQVAEMLKSITGQG